MSKTSPSALPSSVIEPSSLQPLFQKLLKDPDIMEMVISFLDVPFRYVNINPLFTLLILRSSDRFFYTRFSVRIKKLLSELDCSQSTSKFTDSFGLFLVSLFCKNRDKQEAVVEYIQYCEWIGRSLNLLHEFNKDCFVECCCETIVKTMLLHHSEDHEIALEPEIIYNRCFCSRHEMNITTVHDFVKLQLTKLPQQTLYKLCTRYGLEMWEYGSSKPYFFNYLCLLISMDIPDDDELFSVQLFTDIFRAIQLFNRGLDTELFIEFNAEEIVARMRHIVFPLQIKRFFLNMTAASADAKCLEKISFEVMVLVVINHLHRRRHLVQIPDVYCNLIAACLSSVQETCSCDVHADSTGLKILQWIQMNRIRVNTQLYEVLFLNYGDNQFCRELLVSIALYSYSYSETIFKIVSKCLLDRSVMSNFLLLSDKKPVDVLLDWSVASGKSKGYVNVLCSYSRNMRWFRKFIVANFLLQILFMFWFSDYLTKRVPKLLAVLLFISLAEIGTCFLLIKQPKNDGMNL